MNQQREGYTVQIARKRKEREDHPVPALVYNNNNFSPFSSTINTKPTSFHPNTSSSSWPKPLLESGRPNNRILAGYLAHEFLTKGTLLGQKFDPARSEAVPVGPGRVEHHRGRKVGSGEAEPEGKSYADVAALLKTDGSHIPGIVNPTQLARWIQK